jgi:hypothetical protein
MILPFLTVNQRLADAAQVPFRQLSTDGDGLEEAAVQSICWAGNPMRFRPSPKDSFH